jgi:hypothetical protein
VLCKVRKLTPSTVDKKLSSSAAEAKTSFSAISTSLKGLLPATGVTLFLAAEVSSFLKNHLTRIQRKPARQVKNCKSAMTDDANQLCLAT